MAVDLEKLNKEHEKYKSGGSYSSVFKVEPNKTRYILLLWPHKNCEGRPFINTMFHNRELPNGIKAPFSIRCQRDTYEDSEFSKCWPCAKMAKYRSLRKDKGDEYDNMAGKYAPSRKPISQLIDITPCFNKKGEYKRDLKKCFGKFGKLDDCDDCRFSEVCDKFVQKWYMPISCWDDINLFFKDYKDITKPSKMIPIRIIREGKGRYKTKYKSTAFPTYPIKLTSKIESRIDKALLNLLEEDPKPSGNSEEITKKYKDFYKLKDIMVDDDDDDDASDNKSNKKKKSKNNNKKKKNKKSKNSKGSKNVDNLREKMKRKSRKGKMNRE